MTDAAERPRIEPLGGRGPGDFLLRLDGRPGVIRMTAARRVGSNEVLGGLEY